MKKLVLFLLLIMVSLFSFAQADASTVTTVATDTSFLKLLGGYWSELLLGIMAVVKIVVRITPKLTDDKVFGWLDTLIEMIIPNISTKKTDE